MVKFISMRTARPNSVCTSVWDGWWPIQPTCPDSICRSQVEKEASRHEQASLQLMARRGLGAALAAKDPALLKRLNDMR